MEIDNERLLEIAEELDTSLSQVKRLYNLIKDIPCVLQKDDETFLHCLQTLVSDRISETFIQNNQLNLNPGSYKSLRFSISDALYRYYEEEAIPYLCEEYIQTYGLEQHTL